MADYRVPILQVATGLTPSELIATDVDRKLVSLAVATYPSLTELSYVKGVSSAIQTQLGNKQPLHANLTSLAGLSYSALAFVKMSAAGTFSLDTNTYLTSISGKDHSTLNNLSYASAGHTGFEPTVTKGNVTAGSTKITLGGTPTGAAIGAGFSIDVNQANIDHNSLSNYSTNRHIDHTAVSISTTTPLAGGGDISSTRTLTLAGLSSLGTANYVVGVNSGATAWEYKQLLGTSNQITVTHGAGSITLATPQNIHTGASPTFANVIVSTAFYLGSATVDGSWRIVRNGNDLEFQRRESGAWVFKGGVTA